MRPLRYQKCRSSGKATRLCRTLAGSRFSRAAAAPSAVATFTVVFPFWAWLDAPNLWLHFTVETFRRRLGTAGFRQAVLEDLVVLTKLGRLTGRALTEAQPRHILPYNLRGKQSIFREAVLEMQVRYRARGTCMDNISQEIMTNYIVNAQWRRK